MKNLLFRICYDGRRYHGYQVQQNAVTITSTVQDAIEKFSGVRDPIVGCSRTDAGVHANEYFFNMPTASTMPPRAYLYGLNRCLPHDIVVLDCKEVPMDFHARYDTTGKQYIYKIYNAPQRSPFYEGLALHYPYPLDEALMHRAAQNFVGTHDFAGFCSTGSKITDTVRTVYHCSVTRSDDLVTFTIDGNGFLYNMVRILTGTLLKVSEGHIKVDELPDIIASRDRSRAGKTASANGLYLNRVYYDSPAREE